MHTIKQAAARSGLSVPTVRAWERRYGVVQPARTPTGYRLYDAEAIGRLIAMRHLVEHDGIRPSQAAGRILSADEDVVALIDEAARHGTAAAPTRGGTASVERSMSEVEAFVSATRRLDVSTLDRILDGAFASERFESALEHVVFPAMRAIGDAWVDGSIDVAMEHAASETVRRRLARFYDAVAADRTSDVVVGLPPGGRHEIGALAFAVAARRRGVGVVYLGADVPSASWLSAVEASLAPIAVITVVVSSDVAAAGEVVTALRRAPHPPTVMLGGPRADGLAEAAGPVLLPGSMGGAVALVEGVLARAVPRRPAASARA
jgi:methanogenic corrinoid protein MtbC1